MTYEKGDTVHVHADISGDGSGYSLSLKNDVLEAILVRPGSETIHGKHILIVELDELEEHLEVTEDEIRENLILEELDEYFGYKIVTNDSYVE